MSMARLEHVNFTAQDADAKAATLCELFGWKVRWSGDALHGAGRTVHVGSDDFYVAIYSPKEGTQTASSSSYVTNGALNHIAVVVDDIDTMEGRVTETGYTPINHADYEPGRRFYFIDEDGIEFEIVQYD